MGRTNLMILCLGLFACVALSLLMQHVVGIKDKKDVHPALIEINNLFGDQLEQRPTLLVEGKGTRRDASLTIRPKEASYGERLARTVGRYLLHFRDDKLDFDTLQVVVKATAEDPGTPYRIAVPPRMPSGRGASPHATTPGSGNGSGGTAGRARQREAHGSTIVEPSRPPRPTGR